MRVAIATLFISFATFFNSIEFSEAMRRAGNHGGDVPDLSNLPENPTDLRYLQGLAVPRGYEIRSDDGRKILGIIELDHDVGACTLNGGFAILVPSRHQSGRYTPVNLNYDAWYETLERETAGNPLHTFIMRKAAVTRDAARQTARMMSSMDSLYYGIEGG